ncbi:hypothetical protein Taro_002125 [Colocasia esculenta]|uniref:Uncharacterized protein n=1 Tax=Colocasia esculenta TaxID=4460 RepID=A0A843THT8_COLES|nr:hypothetical protein [Colocasia esculenta]
MKGIRNPGRNFDVDPSTARVGLRTHLGVCARTLITLTLNCNGSQPVTSYARNHGWMTQALQNVVQAGNQAVAAARNGAGDLHRNFRSLNPHRFSGSLDPDEAEN